MTAVAAKLSAWPVAMTRRFGKRSANTPPHIASATCGSMNDSVTHASATVDDVKSYTSQPRATICMFIANDDASEPSHSERKSRAASDDNMPVAGTRSGLIELNSRD